MKADTSGRPYLTKSALTKGMTVVLDGGFTCADAGETTVHQDEHGFYVECRDGHHYLDGQIEDGVHLIGVYAKE